MSYRSDNMDGALGAASDPPSSGYGPLEDQVSPTMSSARSAGENVNIITRVHRSLSFTSGQSGVAVDHVIKKGGDVFACGLGTDSRLGLGDTQTRIAPRKLPFNFRTGVGMVACGTRFTVAVTREGHVYSWGRNDCGQLGQRSTVDESRPKIVDSLVKRRVVCVAARGSHVVAATAGGSVFTWGRNDDGQCGVGSVVENITKPTHLDTLEGYAITKVAAGRVHSVAMGKHGEVFTWGAGEDGQLGHDEAMLNDEFRQLTPRRVDGLEGRVVRDVACGSRHTVVLTENDDVFSWGWNQYGQLGLGHKESQATPQLVTFLSDKHVDSLSCGYRHSACVTVDNQVYTWGWGQSGQLGHGNYGNCIVPQLLETLHPALTPHKVVCGGRHTLVFIDNDAGDVYAFGRNDDGQLGLGHHQSTPTPERVLLEKNTLAIAGAAGWAHSVIIAKPNNDFKGRSFHWRDILKNLFVRGDLDAFFGQMLNGLIVLLFIQANANLFGFDDKDSDKSITTTLLPAAGLVLFVGQVVFGIHGLRTMITSGNPDATSLPWGINVVLLFAYLFLIMKPVYDSSLKKMSHDDARNMAYRVGLVANFTTGVLEILCLFAVKWVRTLVPRISMLAALAGTSITFITMGFIFEIWARQVTALLPAIIVVTAFGSQVRLPGGAPAGFVAIVTGIILGWSVYLISKWAGWSQTFFQPFGEHDDQSIDYRFDVLFPLPTEFGAMIKENLGEVLSTSVQYVSVIVPMMLLNLVGNLANLESAEAAGDEYGTFSTLFLDAAVCILGAIFGNPFPTTIYIGHPGFKQMGARHGYLFLAAVFTLFLTSFNLMSVVKVIIPSEACVAILAWIGIVVTAAAFDDEPNVKVKGGVAVAFGMLPAFAAWGFNLIDFTLQAGGLTWLDVHSQYKDKLYIDGVLALKQGYLLTAIVLSSFVMNVMQRKLLRGALWLLIGAILSGIGLIHAFEVTADGVENVYCFGGKYHIRLASPSFFVVYIASALFLVFLHCTVVHDDEDSDAPLMQVARRVIGKPSRINSRSFKQSSSTASNLDRLGDDNNNNNPKEPLLNKV